MTMKSFFKVHSYHTGPSLVLLAFRLVAGTAMMMHGWGKIQTPMSWMGPDSNVPGFLQFLAALSEFGGGLAWILGLCFAVASLGILATMLVAASMHIFIMHDPFVSSGPGGGSYELAALYFCLALLFFVFGPGNYSLDKLIFNNKAPKI